MLRIKLVLAAFLAVVPAFMVAATGAVAVTTNAIPGGYLKTSGNKIVDSQSREAHILGLNWFGFETQNMVVHGLWERNYEAMIAQIASLGFNTIRLPFSSAMLSGTASNVSSIKYRLNTDLEGLTPLQIMDKIIATAGSHGLRVILDNHSRLPDGNDGKWYSGTRPESQWIADWQMLATRYAGNTTVIGADLHNEPSGTWGTGAADDWARAAKAAGDAIHQVNPNWLIIVEGLRVHNNQWYWWGGGLTPVATHPIVLNTPNRLVYSPHDYPPSLHEQPWYQAGNYPNNLPSVWESHWGFIETQNIAPLLLGEFGSRLETSRDVQWADKMADYLETKNMDWVWWSWNANGEPRGLLEPDWTTINQTKRNYLLDLIERTD
ncbi:glycoside hydrolase family 5 protein [Geminicoccus flavidas]|uniref:glycoside hydrolase family 5 protein n=1 Tax=Geminicoccus flavidas TaxID=2506407 RepID=UPI001359B597|nr:glycoside hydrolase family 5 protein [Geminicoccus flavidas]